MDDDMNSYFKKVRDYMEKALDHLQKELIKLRAGKASTGMLSGIMVDYYGNATPLNQVANVGTPDSKTISIQPWEKTMLGPIEQAIFAANIGLTPMNDGEFVRITIPPLTEDRRKELVKQARSEGEEARVSVRHARHKVMEFIKNEVKDGYPEDLGKRKEQEAEDMVKEYTEKINHMVEAKEEDIMKV